MWPYDGGQASWLYTKGEDQVTEVRVLAVFVVRNILFLG